MKLRSVVVVVVAGILSLSACNSQNQETKSEVSNANMENEIDSLSYSLGVNIGTNLKQQFDEINPDMLAKAIAEVYADGALKIDPQAAGQYINNYLQAAASKKAEAAKAEGVAFLAENAKRPEVKTTESGLQYEVLAEGEGASPTTADQVTVHYHGTLINGEVFDSSVDRGSPATFGVTQVIKGWTEALQLMKVGSKYKLYIPSDLAYGDRGAGAKIGPGATLVFEVELLSIN